MNSRLAQYLARSDSAGSASQSTQPDADEDDSGMEFARAWVPVERSRRRVEASQAGRSGLAGLNSPRRSLRGHDVDAASEPGSEAPLEDGMSEAPEPDFEAMLRSGGKGRGGRGRGRGRKASQGGGKGRETGELSASQAAAVEKLKQELGAKKQEFSDDVTRQHLIMRQKHIFSTMCCQHYDFLTITRLLFTITATACVV